MPTTRAKNLLGYARVSTADQTLEAQLLALHEAGCSQIYQDVGSGASNTRSGLDQVMAALEAGDTLVVWRLDRLGRSLPHLVSLVAELRERGVHFRSLQDGVIDTSSASGELVFHLFAAMAQFERQLIRERTLAGLAAARAQGRTGGRPVVGPDDRRVIQVRRLRDSGASVQEIADTLGVGRTTVYRHLRLTEAKKMD